jgi:hypothetical protein
MDTSWTLDQSLAARLVTRMEALRAELALGERRMAALDAERREVRDTLLRISGALQVLRVELGAASGDARVGGDPGMGEAGSDIRRMDDPRAAARAAVSPTPMI